MNTRTVDVRGLEHSEREMLIFPGIEGLNPGDTFRLIVEFNPVPLVFMLKAREEFDIKFEKEGPAEWILNVKRIEKSKADDSTKKEYLKKLLQELKKGAVSEKTKEQAKEFLNTVDAKTLGIVEQELIKEGVSYEDIRTNLCEIHLDMLRDSLVANKMEVQSPHPVHTFMEEHKVILKSLEELGRLAKRLKKAESFKDIGGDVEKLKEISHHLVDAESHHQREEDCLFTRLEKHGITEPPAIMKMDHEEFRKKKHSLYKLAHHHGDYKFEEYKKQAIEYGEYLEKELTNHIFKEDNIIYQISLQVFTPEEWAEVKKECDKIGYCCFTPEEMDTHTLDLRAIPPFQRHHKIFEMWDGLKEGGSMKIINDHDPKPLRYQFEAEYKNQYAWKYEQEGPKDWMVVISRK